MYYLFGFWFWVFFSSTSAVFEPTVYLLINHPLKRSVLICCPTDVSSVFIEEKWKLFSWLMMWCLPACSVSLWTIFSPLSDPQLYGFFLFSNECNPYRLFLLFVLLQRLAKSIPGSSKNHDPFIICFECLQIGKTSLKCHSMAWAKVWPIFTNKLHACLSDHISEHHL